MLYDLAVSFKNQFLDNYYVLKTDTRTIIIYSKPSNFLHLTGLQRCPSLPNYKQKSDFYFDCINNKFTTVKDLIQSLDKKQQNIIQIKTCYFYNLSQSILQSEYLYFDEENIYTCSEFPTNNIKRCQTCICAYNCKYNSYMPKSNQVDIDKAHSCVSKYDKEEILSAKCVPLRSNEGKEIFDKYIKNKITAKGLL